MGQKRLALAIADRVDCVLSSRNGLYKGRLIQSIAGGVLVGVEEGVLLTGESLFLWFFVGEEHCL